MNRRGLLQLLAGSAAALAAGELLIPSRTIFLPPRGGWPTSRLGMYFGTAWLPGYAEGEPMAAAWRDVRWTLYSGDLVYSGGFTKEYLPHQLLTPEEMEAELRCTTMPRCV